MNFLPKYISYKTQKVFGFPKTLPTNLTLGLTYRCNSHCKTCNIWQKSDFRGELTLEEFEKIFKNFGKNQLKILILTGGEPFLHKNIVTICKYAEEYCNPENIVIPTNCILGLDIVGKVNDIMENNKSSKITLNISLDGLGIHHDFIRGTRDNFSKAINVYNELKKISSKKPNLDVGIHTVVSKYNYKNLEEIFGYVVKILNPKNYITEIAEIRNELDNFGLDVTPSSKEYASAINPLIDMLKKRDSSLKQSFRIEYYELVKKILEQKTQVIPCYAGIASAQIDPTGEVWTCCIRAQSVGNLRDTNFDFKKLWYNEKAKNLRKSIHNKECYCPLASASYTNIALNNKSLFNVLWRYLRWKKS